MLSSGVKKTKTERGLRASYAVLISLFFIAIGVSLVPHVFGFSGDYWDWGTGFSINIAAGILVALATTFLVDRILRRNQAEERTRYKTIALSQMRLGRHLGFMVSVFHASFEGRPSKFYNDQDLQGLFPDDYGAQLGFLDFKRPAPVYPPRPWAEWASQQATEFSDALERTIDKYSIFLDPGTVDLLEQIRTSNFLSMLLQVAFLCRLAASSEAGGQLIFFKGENSARTVQNYVTLFSRLAEDYNRHIGQQGRLSMTGAEWSGQTHTAGEESEKMDKESS